jgi:hypothetical protein
MHTLLEMAEGQSRFFQKLERRVEEVNSLLCIGLDPHPQHVQYDSPQVYNFSPNIFD